MNTTPCVAEEWPWGRAPQISLCSNYSGVMFPLGYVTAWDERGVERFTDEEHQRRVDRLLSDGVRSRVTVKLPSFPNATVEMFFRIPILNVPDPSVRHYRSGHVMLRQEVCGIHSLSPLREDLVSIRAHF